MKHSIVVGAGACVWRDLQKIPTTLQSSANWLAINDMVVYAPTVHHGVSHHGDKLPHWLAIRMSGPVGRPAEPEVTLHSSSPALGVARVWPEFFHGGTSALLAVRVALALGYESIIIVGVPLDDGGHIWSNPFAKKHQNFVKHRQVWEEFKPEFAGRVTAVSGYLCDLLGAPPL